ncbi:HalOD1 output domain-containing protein [Natronococcus sp. A-GB7]|uniref:HalOD1 output domain-containing protein n=1 Tax=Natronococcus sp. A-GB7 TaxID=3037649 RepID=UPI00241BFCF8|nr:HalOD1 output domain-containing protein [Natronococcus sp. A-GB7]MDG5821782.1 hypothetical protein [Natronococcus sp. A-GB7]
MSDPPVQQTSPTTAPEQRSDYEPTPVVAVISAVADAAGTDPLKLPPLSNVIDPEALNDLVDCGRNSALRSISFEYAGYDVIVSGTGDIQVA